MQKLFVSCMRKRRRGWIDLFAAVVYWRLCVLGFEKTPYSQWDASAWRPVVSFDSVWSGDEDGIYGRMGRRLPGYGAALMMGIGETCGYLIRVGSLLIVLFPLYLFRMIGAGDIKMAAVLFGAAGLRQGGRIFLCGLAAAGIWSLVLLIRRGIARQRLTYLVFYLYRSALGGSVEPYYLEARDGKEASFCLAPCLFLGVIGAELIRYL